MPQGLWPKTPCPNQGLEQHACGLGSWGPWAWGQKPSRHGVLEPNCNLIHWDFTSYGLDVIGPGSWVNKPEAIKHVALGLETSEGIGSHKVLSLVVYCLKAIKLPALKFWILVTMQCSWLNAVWLPVTTVTEKLPLSLFEVEIAMVKYLLRMLFKILTESITTKWKTVKKCWTTQLINKLVHSCHYGELK